MSIILKLLNTTVIYMKLAPYPNKLLTIIAIYIKINTLMPKSILNSSKSLITIAATYKSINYYYLIHFSLLLLLAMSLKLIFNSLDSSKLTKIN